MDEVVAKLEAKFCPPLDPALVSAIVWDYDLQSDQGLADARATLSQLKDSADAEEAAEFDPSGTGGNEASSNVYAADAAKRTPSPRSAVSISDGLSSLSLDSAGTTHDSDVNLDDLDEETKILLLHDVLGDQVDSYTIQHTLRACKGEWNAAFGELLNHAHIREVASEGEGYMSTKGIDGFAEPNGKRGRKGKARNRKFRSVDERRSASMPSPPDESQKPVLNKWQQAAKDIDFLVTRTGMDSNKVKSAYYNHEANLARTVNALLRQYMHDTASTQVTTNDDSIAANALALGYEFPSLDANYLAALVRLTHPSTASAFDLAEALTTKPNAINGNLQIIPQYARPVPEAPTTSSTKTTNSTYAPSHPGANITEAQYAQARDYAKSQARAARKHPGAAGYYNALASSHSASMNSVRAKSFSALAASQSTSTSVDLHGVDVANGVRIAMERVEAWWSGLGEARVNGRVGAGARGGGYEVIVGKGTHSEGGRGKLGPAVGGALRKAGWRVEDEGGKLRVRGKR
ncbi:hypothetical protein B0A48_10418 [Cryoendolithus antarcticus]|uniref:Smr domain-containing protein n=1 Tax=Cryoendolithus antarcticus TaxID=1507870 RepID=A0A1V8SXS5_9PEZI|nr:hypothetical protein B0A48_10418 [Cryoendolithus antarcticus]